MKRWWIAAAGLLAGAAPLGAQGLNVATQSACMSGRVNAGIATPCDDGSAVYYNPAGIALLPAVATIGLSDILVGGSFTADRSLDRTELDKEAQLAPHAYLTYRPGPAKRLGVGVGVFAPFGLALRWPSSFAGRFAGFDNSLRAVMLQPTAAYQLVPGKLAIGAGLDVVFSSIDINLREDLSRQNVPGGGLTFANLGIAPGTDFASVELKGNQTSLAGSFGIIARPTARLSLGARYTTRSKARTTSADARFTQVPTGLVLPAPLPLGSTTLPAGTPLDQVIDQLLFQSGGALANQSLSTEFTFPAVFVGGASFEAADGLVLSADYQWSEWSTFGTIPLTFQTAPAQALVLDWKNTSTYRVGAAYEVDRAWRLRGGWSFNTAALPAHAVSPLLPEGERNEYTVGVGWRAPGGFGVDAFYNRVVQQDRRGRLLPRTETVIPPDVGVFGSDVNVFGATISYRW